jgi:hypothetical protein
MDSDGSNSKSESDSTIKTNIGDKHVKEEVMPKLKLTNIKFFRWTGNITANDIRGLDPRNIDKIYTGGGKHCPIITNLSFEN